LIDTPINRREGHDMAKRSRKRIPSMPVVHDRRSSDLLRNADVAPVEIDDPIEQGGKLLVMRSLRDDPLARMHCRKQVDEAQYQAGRAFQNDWENAEEGPRAIDPSKEAVDGGRTPEPFSEHKQRALARLAQCSRKLGMAGEAIVHDVLVHGRTMAQIAKRRGLAGQKWEEYFGKRFRECLETLAEVYGLVMKKSA
jgi:hypothetical protein